MKRKNAADAISIVMKSLREKRIKAANAANDRCEFNATAAAASMRTRNSYSHTHRPQTHRNGMNAQLTR